MRVKHDGPAGGRTGGRERRTAQLPLLPTAGPPVRPTAVVVLDQRLRGTKFVSLEPKSVLNSPQQTGVDFWSLNPYIGCEFGCTYCYARYAHRYTVERAHDAGKLTDDEFVEVTPKSLRLRKKVLQANKRKRGSMAMAEEER